uniref:GOLD domain-containing protein n=1 Tax=Trieres chinensis TaxID=1514140 RepID=A0A7S2EHI0_TRICV|mmetsp:Transcript_23104/g.46884  ORF Transcript_23104/g.46884 Transcript_23104/m.46884 type:complete len:234 (+) Transcript_23104:64-765(+)|eukprot:CAMPEP_0183296940 /NCGR_PEP_ID=MMETSP0160_2-20130417/4343_1 /TAXON_ID=2839 ORGANISM="Odontella Sinensis, Strain Grunow 1884" /NCGR_SAMPLE_ID=MMETSP0160_2 /ASSEMBLY_ACC=CAM_ASM_000250 /LENGTH=233 /DNA_ID=CAMNT_0025458645 /DNA_START=35 /DNA_END=736 /DNA_ORIENTATION=+
MTTGLFGRCACAVAVTAALFGIPQPCGALPQFIVTSGRPKCVTVTVPDQTDLRVEYEAPDLDPGKGPVWITISTSQKMDRLRDKIAAHRHQTHKTQSPLSEEIKEKRGSIKHTVEADGEVSICVRASIASGSNPMRFGISCSTTHSSSEVVKEKEDKHLNHLEVQMVRLKNEMSVILREADFAKEREMVFHGQSISMNAASMWWPIIQLSVLLLTGFTQAMHMIGFFKSRHII